MSRKLIFVKIFSKPSGAIYMVLCFINFFTSHSFQIGLNATGGQKSNNPFL